ncbi:MAG: site-specific integrase [Myxococcota bacterium]
MMQRNTVLQMVKRRAERLGMDGNLCTHSFRATGITAYVEAGGSLQTAAQMAGHADVRTTQLYVRSSESRAVGQDELRKLFEACRADQNEALGARDLAIFAVLYGGGLRRAEVARLDYEDFDFERYGLLIRGKGNKERRIFLPRSIEGALQPWVDFHRGSSPGPFFVPVSRNGALQRARYIHPDVVYNVTQKRLREAGLKAMTPHDLRRTFISDLLDRSVDVTTVSHHVGHASVQTTARYDRRGDRALEAAAEEIQLPLAND